MATETTAGSPAGQDQIGVSCSICGKTFQPRFSYQLQERDGQRVAYCSARCQLRAMTSKAELECSVCAKAFVAEFAFQTAVFDGQRVQFCSMECRERRRGGGVEATPIRRLAVYNLKGGTGKTTTAVSVASALARLGVRVLLVDADPQGSVSVCLGVSSRRGLYQALVLGIDPGRCVVPAREGLDVLLSDRTLAGAEVYLAGRPERHRVMRDRLAPLSQYDLIVIDCSPSLGLLSQNALRCADSVLIPVSCDFLGVVGLQQATRVITDLEQRTGHKLTLVGVLPTFHDGRLRHCRDAMETLNKHYGEAVLPPIRINAKLREAPSQRKTIFEHDHRSTGATDYEELASWMLRQHLHRKPKVVEGDQVEPKGSATS